MSVRPHFTAVAMALSLAACVPPAQPPATSVSATPAREPPDGSQLTTKCRQEAEMAVASSKRSLRGHNLQTIMAGDGSYRSTVLISYLNQDSWDGKDFTDAGRYVCRFVNDSMTSFTFESDAPPPPPPRGRRG